MCRVLGGEKGVGILLYDDGHAIRVSLFIIFLLIFCVPLSLLDNKGEQQREKEKELEREEGDTTRRDHEERPGRDHEEQPASTRNGQPEITKRARYVVPSRRAREKPRGEYYHGGRGRNHRTNLEERSKIIGKVRNTVMHVY
ncbi:hypothetical protein M405DRAFT_883368 [Rhizopogon salebrosus TDB-379]|nr:hypothetical protein M405DRAFT_883368 [Rhizopogon salebrosus TDB-379]